MIIGIDASRANKKHKSGTEWYAYYLIRQLAKIDRDNQYILYSDQPLKNGLVNLKNGKESYTRLEIDKKGRQKIISPHNNFEGKILKWPFDFFWTQGRMSLEMIFKKPDALFVPSHALPLIHPKNSIVTIHDVGFLNKPDLYQKNQLGPENIFLRKLVNCLAKIVTLGKYSANSVDYLRWSTEYALKKAKKIISVSNFSKEEIVKNYKINQEKIKVIYNGLDKNLYKKLSDQDYINCALSKYGISEPFILYVGRLEMKKNIPALVEAFGIFKEENKNFKHKLVLAGDASYGYDEVNYVVKEYRLDDDVVITGWIEEEDLPCLFNAAEAFVFPSNYEGFGIPLLQAMACEIPILASKNSSIPEVAGSAALLFDPENISSMACSIKKILTDEKLKKELVEEGRKRIKNFSWEICAQKTLKEIISP